MYIYVYISHVSPAIPSPSLSLALSFAIPTKMYSKRVKEAAVGEDRFTREEGARRKNYVCICVHIYTYKYMHMCTCKYKHTHTHI